MPPFDDEKPLIPEHPDDPCGHDAEPTFDPLAEVQREAAMLRSRVDDLSVS